MDEAHNFFIGDGQWLVHNCEEFPNQLPNELERELRIADNRNVQVIRVGEAGWKQQLNQVVNNQDSTGMIKWVVDVDNNLLIIPHEVQGIEINHTVLTRGANIIAAGEANIAGAEDVFFGLEINRHSGHYQPSADSLKIGVEAFRNHGITFGNVNASVD